MRLALLIVAGTWWLIALAAMAPILAPQCLPE
jgi:hypothetical protein